MIDYRKYESTDYHIYEASLKLRNTLLRAPIGKSIYDENLSVEKENDFYGAFYKEQLIGTLSCYDESAAVAHLTAFAVDKDFQKQGIGKRLTAFLIRDLKLKKYLKINVDARAHAREFYQKCGFVVIEGPVVNGVLETEEYRMEYVLKPDIE